MQELELKIEMAVIHGLIQIYFAIGDYSYSVLDTNQESNYLLLNFHVVGIFVKAVAVITVVFASVHILGVYACVCACVCVCVCVFRVRVRGCL